jgi:hypothetical protein
LASCRQKFVAVRAGEEQALMIATQTEALTTRKSCCCQAISPFSQERTG